jgi:hypothetical protein
VNWKIIGEPTILATAVVYGVLTAIALGAGIFGLPLAALLFFSLWRYCYSVLRAVAQGRLRIPPPDLDSFNPVGEWAVFWHFIAMPGLVIATTPYQPLGFVVAAAVAIAFPASVALMGLTSNLQQAFSPSALIGFARTVGSDYLRLVVGCLAIIAGAVVCITYVAPSLGFGSLLVGLVIEIWALYACFALIGSVLRAHRTEFEIPGELKPREEEALEHQHRECRKDLDIASGAFRSGLHSSGYKTLHDLVAANGDSLEINHWLVENMLDWQDKRYALEVAGKLMQRLLDRDDGAGALELYHRCRRRDPEFRLPPDQADKLAQYASDFGQSGVAAELSYNR